MGHLNEQHGLSLLGTKPGTCPECGHPHEPTAPHNQQSLAYQYSFYDKRGYWPTWTDAMSHCSEETKTMWTAVLKGYGIEMGDSREMSL